MRVKFVFLVLLVGFYSCKNQGADNSNDDFETDSLSIEYIDKERDLSKGIVKDTIEVEAIFTQEGFEDTKYYDLLIETRICNPDFAENYEAGTTPCSSKFFKFYEYNENRSVEDAFMLQVRAGVNNYPYRRLLIFVREKGELVLMNGVVGYLVKQIPQENGIDDLIVAVFDDLGNDKFDRYDVLLRYQNGKYEFIEAVGDLEGEFKSEKLKKVASEEIYKRIMEKDLVF